MEFLQSATEVGLPDNLVFTKQNTNVGDKIYFSASFGWLTVDNKLWNDFTEVQQQQQQQS